MRLSSKIVGAGLILSGTVLAGCNCCDSCRRTASSQNPASSPYLASKQQPGSRSNWTGQPNQNPIMQAGAVGQPGYGVQQSSWNYPPAGSGRMTGNMTPGSPAIPVTGAGSSPVSSNGSYSGTLATSGALGAQPSSFGTRTSASTGAYSAPTGSTGAYRSTTGLGAYGGPAPNYGTPSPTSPTAASGASVSAMPSAGSPSNSQVFNVSGSSAAGQPSSTPADPSGTPSNSTASPGAGSTTETPTVTGSAKGFGN